MSAKMRTWLAEPLPRDVAVALDRLAQIEDVATIAVMPDVHLAEEVCVGTVVATRELLLPAAIGSDLGCGMAAIGFHAEAAPLAEDELRARRLLAEFARAVPILVRRDPAPLPTALAEWPLSDASLARARDRDGRREFGTLGRGNHFVELQQADDGTLWLMVHSGSRALGPAIVAHHARAATLRVHGLAALVAESREGRAFLGDVEFALQFAAASRRAIVDTIAPLVERECGGATDRGSLRECVHNFVRREPIGGAELWIHRKGAIDAADGQPGIIPGSMGAASFHVTGRGNEAALRSSSHGAGRALPRGVARRQVAPRELLRSMRGVWFDERRAAALVEEAPAAYKDIGAVMRAQRDLTRIVRRLRPVLSFKGA